MPWTAVVGAVASGVVSEAMSSGSSSGNSGANTSSAAAAADPFAGQRDQYKTALQQLMTGGTSEVGKDPSYQFRFDQGEQAIERSAAAGGYFGSGNMGTALVDYGQKAASTEYANQFSRLAQLSGANVGNPGTAGQIIAGQSQANQQSQAAFSSTVGKAVGSANWGNILGGGSGGGGYVDTGTVTGADMSVAY